MVPLLESLFRRSAPLIETGLSSLDAALRGAQSMLAKTLGDGTSDLDSPPTAGPRNVEEATAEFANRLLRGARRTPWKMSALPDVTGQVLDAFSRSFRPRGPRDWLALPFEMPLAFASLATQEALRGIATAQFVPLERMPEFLSFVVEIFTDLHVYFSLQYPKELAHWQQRLRRDPGDHRARLELARTYTKCGLYPEAVAELEPLRRKPEWRRRALYESLIASYRVGDHARAIADGADCLELAEAHQQTRFWLWLAAQKAGGYPETVGEKLRMEARDGYHPTSVRLEDVAEEIGLDKTSGGRGSAVFDVDGDGYLDIVFAGAHAGCSLYRNDGRGGFVDASTGSGLDSCVYGFAVAAGDYDNDGKTDLYISSLGFFNGQGRLMRNDGVGSGGQVTFTDVTAEAGLDTWGPGFTATWIDYDGDGHLDLFLANNLGGFFDRKTPNRLFRNNGDGTFTDVTAASGLETRWTSIGAAWGDFSNDGRPDLFVSSLGRAQLFRNNGDGTFTDVSREAGVDAPANGSVAMVCDIDDDGWLDIVQLTYSRPDDAIYTLRHGHGPPDGSPMRVFRNNRDGTFTDIAGELGITGCWGTMSANAGDVSNDGHLDLFLGNGDPAMDRTEASVLLQGNGRAFRNVSFAAGLPFTGKGHGVNLADLAGDGRLHLIVASGGLYPADLLTNGVYRPTELPGNYLNVRLQGTKSNRDAIGARLALSAGGRQQHRLVSGGSFFGCLPLEQHFGLGDLSAADSLAIRWPSGRRQTIDDLPINATIRIVEGDDGWEDVYGQK
ncbi:MAG: CRTAC1 family protein [bacterium]|nr:CRTAC1 family protein [bacterium]